MLVYRLFGYLRPGSVLFIVFERLWAFTRFGGDLLSRGLSPSTIGAAVLNFRVRDGTGCFTCAMTTKPRKIPVALFALQKGDAREAAYSLANARSRTVIMSINSVAWRDTAILGPRCVCF